MGDVERALADIAALRRQVAAGTQFRGFGPIVLGATAGLALVLGVAQASWPAALAADDARLAFGWVVLAAVASALVGASAWRRARRLHGPLAETMIRGALRAFLPAGIAGAALTVVLVRTAPDLLWLLPGLWQGLMALGLAAARPNLPPGVVWVMLWYAGAGVVVLALAAETRSLAPWMMAGPFAVGQALLALVVWHAGRGDGP